MVGVHVVSHLARRGVEALSASQDQFHIEQLKKAARLYEDTPGAEIKPVEMLPMLVTALLFLALFVSVCLKSKVKAVGPASANHFSRSAIPSARLLQPLP